MRFLIAETESGYTLLVALWLARLLRDRGAASRFQPAVRDQARRSMNGARGRSRRRCARGTGATTCDAPAQMALQFGYSDSVGAMSASSRPPIWSSGCGCGHRRPARRSVAWPTSSLILFDTHGESIGRGGAPVRVSSDRLDYLSHAAFARLAFAGGRHRLPRGVARSRAATATCCSARGELADATIGTVAEHAFAVVRRDERSDLRPAGLLGRLLLDDRRWA